jgi:hypothetical protein
MLAATVLAGGQFAAIAPALAQGSDEDRIAALEAQVQMLMQEIQAMKAEQASRPAPAPAPPAALAQRVTTAETTGVPMSLQPQTTQVPPRPGVAGHPFYAPLPEGRTTGILATGNDTVRLSFSGQINRALNVVDDGQSTDLYQVDNENASSRFRFLGETSPYNDTVALTAFEFEWPVNGTLDVSQLEETVSDSLNRSFNLRLLEVGFSNNRLGSAFIGQGWMASDGTAEIDISGITTPFWSGQTFAFGGMLLTAEDGPGVVDGFVARRAVPEPGDYATDAEYQTALADFSSNPSNFVNVFQTGNALDGLSRAVRVRYNTPVYAGFQLSASAATEDRYDVALRYAGETEWARIAAAASYWTQDNDDGYDGYTGSASIFLKGGEAWYDGLSFTLSAATQDFDSRSNSPTTYFGKVGYVADLWNIGRTGFALGYGNYDDFRVEGESVDMWGLGISQNIDPLGTEVYLGLTNYSADSREVDYNDMTLFQFGTMVRF